MALPDENKDLIQEGAFDIKFYNVGELVASVKNTDLIHDHDKPDMIFKDIPCRSTLAESEAP
jgi:hypothetical protein